MVFHTWFFTGKNISPKLQINGVEIKQVKEFNFMGVVINGYLNWKYYVK